MINCSKFAVTGRKKEDIKDNNGKITGSFYKVCLSDGENTYHVTCGANSPLVSIDLMKFAMMDFRLDEELTGKDKYRLKLVITNIKPIN